MSDEDVASRQAEAVFRIDQLLALRGLQHAVSDPGATYLYGPARIDVNGNRATTKHYVRTHEAATGRLSALAYGRWDLARNGGSWEIATSVEHPTGRPEAPAFLLDGLASALETPVPVSSDDPDIRRLADEQAIRNVIATYGLAADGGSPSLVGALYTDDTFVDVEGQMFLEGRRGVAEMIGGADHQRLLPWAAHTMGPGLVVVRDDHAVSTHYARTYGRTHVSVYGQGPDDRALWRFSVNRWELQRGSDGRWRVSRRTSRSPGHPESGPLLARGLDEHFDSRIAGSGRPLLDAAAALATATAAAMAPGSARALMREAPFAGADAVARDGVVGLDMASLLSRPLFDPPLVAGVPGPGFVILDGDDAHVVQPLLSYRELAHNRYEVGDVAYGRWSLRRNSEAQWHVTDVSLRRAADPAATTMVRETLPRR